MSINNKELISYLKEFVSINRFNLFQEKADLRTNYITVVLEDIFQSRNISASIRSADCFGIQNIHIIENYNSFNHDSEVSLGSEKWVSLNRYNNSKENSISVCNMLKSNGYQIIATTPHNTDCSLYELDISKKIALVFGSEINGCSQDILKIADKKMNIPMYGFSESFNISVSVSLCLQHLTYLMRKNNINWQLENKMKNQLILNWLRNSIKYSEKIEKKYYLSRM